MRTRTSRHWDVPPEFWILLWRARGARTLIMQVDGEPQRKSPRRTRSAADFQRQVMDDMSRYRRYPFTGPVALDLHFATTRRNPPIIDHLAKHTLDLLGPALPGNERPRRRSVLYHDDRQVKLLYVGLDQGWYRDDCEPGQAGSTYIIARRARDAIADLCLAYRVSGERHNEDEDSPYRVPDLPDDPEPPDWLLRPGPDATRLERFLAEAVSFHHLTQLQESVLARTNALLASALSVYLEDHARAGEPERLAGIFEGMRAQSRDLQLSNPLALPLPGLPRASGESTDFARLIRASLEEFRSRWPLFTTLLTPVMLTFLVIPPEQGKDLDNIALTALPIAHEVLRPHIAPHLLTPSYQDGQQQPWRDEALTRLKSLNVRSISAYQVVELPRSAHDPPQGVLRLALSSHSRNSWWDQAASYLDEALEQAWDREELAKQISESLSGW